MKAKRWISILLCILMIWTWLPVSAFAEEGSCAEGHDYVPEVTDPTCTADGFTAYTCSRCGDSYTEPGEAMPGHAWDDGTITTEPTPENEGVRTFTCNRCGETYVEQIPKLEPISEDHKAEDSAEEDPCVEGHDYVPEATEPTCTADGFTTYTCSRCGDSYKVDGEVALGHSYDNGVTTDPTCTEAGFTTFTCTRCGDSYKVDGDATLGHSYDDGVVTTEPTVDAEGVKTFTCVRCGDSYTETVPKLEPEQPVTKRLLAAPALRSLSDTVYTVTLKAGDGTDSDVVIRSDEEGRMAASLQEATKGQFWDEGDNGVWFKLPDCPFTAPVNSSFVGWNGTSIGPGTPYKLTDTELTLTATWQENQENNADYALSVPLNVTLSGTGITEIPITATKLVLGKATSAVGGGYIDADVLDFMCTIDALKNSKGDTISCSYTNSVIVFRDVGTETISVSFDPEVYASSAPGVYTGTLNYDCKWEETGGLTSPRFGSGSISLMLNISAVDEYTVTLSPGGGGGNPITYSAAVEEIAESRQAAGNCQFYYENGGGLGFRLDEAYCPSTFTAPDGGYIFNGWDGSTGYISLTEASTVLMANWQKADITLVPSSITLTGAGDNTVTLEPKGPDGLRSVNISFKNGSLSNGTYEIPFTCSGEISRRRATEITVTVDSSAFAAAAPGQYTGWLNYSGKWRVGVGGADNRFSGSLPVSLIVPERDQYTLTVTASPLEGGTVTGGGTYYENMSVTVTATANNGYAFVNWTENGSEVSTDATYSFTATVARNLVANFKGTVATHTVTVNNGSGSGNYAAGASVTITANEPESGKQFKEWTGVDGLTFTSGSATTATAIFTMPANAVTVTATYENIPVVSYTVTYKVAGGTWADGTTEDKTETVASGSSPASVPTGMIASSGYEGGGWDTDPASATITGDKTFTYTFDAFPKPDYTVHFNANVPANASTACAGSMEDQKFAYDEKKLLSENGYSLPGYDFEGWNTKADGTGTAYADNAKVEGLLEDGGTVLLYAQWRGKPYTIEYWSDDAGSQKHIQTAYFDRPGRLDVYSDRAFGWHSGGKTLHGWNVQRFGSFLEDGDDFVNLCGTPDADGYVADLVIVADWVQNGQLVVTVTKNGVPQEGLEDYLTLVQGGTLFSVPIHYESGRYIFDTSKASAPGTGPAQLPAGTYELQFKAAGYPAAKENITYGQYNAVSVVFDFCTVSLTKDAAYFNYNDVQIGGETAAAPRPGVVVVRNGDKLIIKTTVAEGYRFEGYTAVGVTPAWGNNDPSVAEQTIQVQGKADIAAHVSPIEYSVTVVGGTADVTTAYAGDTVTITADAAEYGHAFVQWAYVDDVKYVQMDALSTTFTMPAKDVTLSVVFKEIILPAIADQTYTGEEITPTFGLFGVTLDGVDAVFPNRYVLTCENNVNVGTATVTLTFKDRVTEEPDSRLGTKSATFKITPADISSATVEIADQTYNGTQLTPDAKVIWYGQVLTTDDYTLSYSDNVNVGQAAVTVTGKGNFDENTMAAGTFTINKASLTITANDQEYTYNGQIQGEGDTAYEDPAEIAEKVTVSGLQGSDALTSVILDGQGQDAKAYDLLPGNATVGEATGNYEITYVPGTLTINPASVKITVDDRTKVRGEADPVFTGTVEGLIAAGDLGEITYARTNNDEDAGTYADVIDAAYAANPNYAVTVVKGDFTIRELYTVIWKGADGSELGRASYAEGDPVPTYTGETPTKPATAQYTYVFSRWDDGTAEGTTTIYEPVFIGNVNKYTVKFVDYDGTTVLKEATAYDYGTLAADIARPDDPAREADAQYTYTFAGWDPEITGVTGGATYKATYTKEPIPVKKGILTFDLAGGTLDGKSGIITLEANVGDVINLPGAPIREGCIFQYWKGSEYEAGAEYMVEGDHTFTAVWEENKAKIYTVTFDANGHGTAPAAQTAEDGQTAARPADPAVSGWTFGGWYKEAVCTNAFDFSTPITADITLYAKWTEEGVTPIDIIYTVTSGSNSTWTHGSTSSVTITVKRSEDDASCFSHYAETLIDGKVVTVSAKSGSTVITISADTLEKLSTGTHTVTVKFDDGQAETKLTVKAAPVPADPTIPKTDDSRIPNTGDSSHLGLWISLLCLSVAALAALFIISKKRRARN